MTTTLFARHALTASGWRKNVSIRVNYEGKIASISDEQTMSADSYGILLPAISNLHSHSFQRAMAGLSEVRSNRKFDDFWRWRERMYHFLELLTPDDVESISAQVQMQMLESGYASVGEFHYLHHGPGGARYHQADEMSERLFQAALTTGIGYTHLPVLYSRGGLDGREVTGGQLRFGCQLDEFMRLYEMGVQRMNDLPNDFALGVAPHSLRAVSTADLNQIINVSATSPIHIHIAEQQSEVNEVMAVLGTRPVRWLLDNMPLDKRWCLVHATHTEIDEVANMVSCGVVAGLCPITEANLGDGTFDGNGFLMNGGRFGIGSDSNVRISLSEELRLLEFSQRLRDQRRVVLASDTYPSNGRFLYQHAALGGAQALGRSAGEIGVDRLADIVALDDQHPNLIGLSGDALLDAWIFASSDDIVSDVWAAGRHVVTAGEHIRRPQITERFKMTMQKIRQTL